MNQIEKVARAFPALWNLVQYHKSGGHSGSGTDRTLANALRELSAIAAMPVQAEPVATRWQLGDKVKKKANSSWRGVVCGFYSTPHTPVGYCVDSAFEPGSVQVWPEAALEDWDGVMVEDELRAEITRLTEARLAALKAHADALAGGYRNG